jgi:multidrug efflux pump
VRRAYARLLDARSDALRDRRRGAARDGRGLAAARVLAQELAPVEDQGHISLFLEAAPDSTLEAANRESLKVVKQSRRSPRRASCGR